MPKAKTKTAKQSKKCKICKKRKSLAEFAAMPRAKDGTGKNPNCLLCIGKAIAKAKRNGTGAMAKAKAKRAANKAKPAKRRKAKVALSDAHVNAVLADVSTVVSSQLMPVVSAVIRVMRANGNRKLTIDFDSNQIEILSPERFPLPETN